MNKKEIKMLRAQNVIKYLISFVFYSVFYSCASQNIETQNKTNLAYQLIKDHYSNRYIKKKQNYIHYKTQNKESTKILMRKPRISNFLRYDKFSIQSKICHIDSTLSKTTQQKLDSAYVNFEEVELEQKKIKSKNIKLIYTNNKVYKKELVSSITFPIIVQDMNVYYGLLTVSDVYGGELYFYKYEKGNWELICHRMLFVV